MKRFLIFFVTILLISFFAHAEGIPVRDNIYIGDSMEIVLTAEPFGIMLNDENSGIVTSNKGFISGVPGSYVEYIFDDLENLYGANFIFNTNASFDVLKTSYDHIESTLTSSFGEKISGVFGANIGIDGYTYQFYNDYKAGLSSYPDVIGFSERVIILENYNIKIEHLLLRKNSGSEAKYHHYLCYEKFLDSDAPIWAKEKKGFVYTGNSEKNQTEENSSEIASENNLGSFEYSMLDDMSVSELEKLRDEINRRIYMIKPNITSVPTSSPTLAKNKGIWIKQYFVDEFDLPTENTYIRPRNDILGTFSNSAVDNRELKVRFLVTDDREIHIFLYEYGDNLVKNIFSSSAYYDAIMLDRDKTKHELEGRYHSHGDRLFFTGVYFDTIIQALSLGGEVRFVINAKDSLDSYSFTIKDVTGFDVAYEDMLNTK